MSSTQYVLNPKNADEVLTNVYDPVSNSIGGGGGGPGLGSYIRRTGGISTGAVATTTMIFSTPQESNGADITYVTDANQGDKFVINTSGVYSVSTYEYVGGASQTSGISVGVLNSGNISDSRTLSTQVGHCNSSWTGHINAGQEVYIFCDAPNAVLATNTPNQVTIARLA